MEINGAPTSVVTDEPLLEVIDRVNHVALQALHPSIPVPHIVASLARGSLIQSRLQVSQFRWQLLARHFGIDPIVDRLRAQLATDAVEEGISALRRRISAKVLRHGDPLGPAKLAVRLRVPDETLWSRVELPQIEALVCGLPPTECDEIGRSLLAETALTGASLDRTRDRMMLLSARLCPEVETIARSERFAEMVDGLHRVFSLHPYLPIHERALRWVAEFAAMDASVAHTAIALLRFCWLLDLESEEDLSDISFKSIVIVPETVVGQRAFRFSASCFRQAIESEPTLREFHRSHPAIRVGAMMQRLCLPMPLFEIVAGDADGDLILELLIMSRIGGRYLLRLLRKRGKMLGIRLEKEQARMLVAAIRHEQLKTPCFVRGEGVGKTIQPLGLWPERVAKYLAEALESPTGPAMKKCVDLFSRIGREDYKHNLRGCWLAET